MKEHTVHSAVAFPAYDHATKIPQPDKCALHLLPALIAPQLAPGPPRREPHVVLFPVPQAPPTSAGRGLLFREVFPARSSA